MRPSGIAQGLKSWASKLHPNQGPLTNQESSRLLNALTSAFRQKLDEAHPRNADEDPKHATSSKVGYTSTSAFHSSAAHADKHLASVLTNPLLGGRVLDYGTAKVELTKNPSRDSIELLEEYQEKGAATVRVAEICLQHFRQSIERLPQDKQGAAFETTQAGRRVLKWLLGSSFHDSAAYSDNITFIQDLVFCLVKEGREENIWSWIKLDIGNMDGAPPNTVNHRRKTNLYKYRWRGRVLRAMIQARLGPTEGGSLRPNRDQMNAAFDTLFEVCAFKQSTQEGHLKWIPMAPISSLFGTLCSKGLHEVRPDLDVQRFEKYYEMMPVICDGAPPFPVAIERAKLRLIHPEGRQPAEALRVFRLLFAEEPPKDKVLAKHVKTFVTSIRETGKLAAVHVWWMFASATIYALRQEGRLEDAEWLKSRCFKEFPMQTAGRGFEAQMDQYRRYDMARGARLKRSMEEVQDSTPVPFPTFA